MTDLEWLDVLGEYAMHELDKLSIAGSYEVHPRLNESNPAVLDIESYGGGASDYTFCHTANETAEDVRKMIQFLHG